jgi:activator of HSP90 ATPase
MVVKSLKGDASVAIAGGKKLCIFDYHTELSFEIKNKDDVVAKGNLQLPDISSACHDDLEVEMLAWKTSPSCEENSEAANICRKSLVGSVLSSVQRFVEAFNHSVSTLSAAQLYCSFLYTLNCSF